jgi:hypothetical protein
VDVMAAKYQVNHNTLLCRLNLEGLLTRQERFAGSQRRIINQIRTGVVSGFMLRDILKRRSEHLWSEELDVQ